MSQYHDLMAIDSFDVRDRIATLKPRSCCCAAWTTPAIRPIREDARGRARLAICKTVRRGHFRCTEVPDEVAR